MLMIIFQILPSLSPKPWIGFHFATHYNADQRTTNAANRCVLRAYNAAKCNCGRAIALNKAAEGVTAQLPQILLVLRGRFVALRGEDRKEGEGQEGSWESNGDGDSDAKLLSNRLNCQLIGGGGMEP